MEMQPLKCSCNDCIFRSLLYKDVDNKDLAFLCSNKEERHYKKGEVILRQGEDIKDFLYLREGLIKLYLDSDHNRSQIVCVSKPYDFVSLLSAFSHKKASYSISALEDSKVCYVGMDIIDHMIRTNGEFAKGIIEKISASSEMIIKSTFELKNKQLRGRIAFILLDFATNIYKNNVFELPVSRKEIAELIGMTMENVIRTLSEFRRDGLIKINGKIIEITNPELMRKLSENG